MIVGPVLSPPQALLFAAALLVGAALLVLPDRTERSRVRLSRVQLLRALPAPTGATAAERGHRDGPADGDEALAADLLAAALEAGAPLSTALRTVAAALSGPLAVPLAAAGSALALGATPESALLSPDSGDVLARFGRALRRSGDSGARLAAQLRLLADDLRAESAARAVDRARRVGVLAVLPLGMCSLPAFMLLGVVPLAAGLVASMT